MNKERFGTFIAQRRRELGLTQRDLAQALHLTDKAVSKWERGLSYPDVTLLEPLAAKLELTVGELMACRVEAAAPEAEKEEPMETLMTISKDTVRRERRRSWQRLIGVLVLLAAAVAFIFLMRRFGYVALDSLYIPFWNKTVPVSEPLYVIFAAFVIVGTVNSVNLTDGVDGLAASTTMPVCIFFAVISMLWGERFLSLGVFASGLAGGLLGFLIYNFHPAKVFMGDTGSLFLGGAVAALAFAYDMPLILVTLGIMYIIEALSDIIQVGYFKLTHGKRVFKMSPYHHHLEMGGWTGHKWKETQIVALFAGVTVLFAVLSFIGVFHRFGV